MRRSTVVLLVMSATLIVSLAGSIAQATAPAYISMENGLDPSILGPDPCTQLMHALGQCNYTHLDPAYAPPLAIDREPSTTTASTPSDPQAPCGGMAPLKSDGTAWRCTFADEFGGTSLNAANWTQQLTAAGTTGTSNKATSACFTGSPNNVSVGSGELDLTVRKEAASFACAQGANKAPFTTQYTGGGVYTKGHFTQTYGRFEVRAAFPATVQKGLQSALWLWPDDPYKYGLLWPASGEIDTAEYYTSRPGFVVPTLHYNANTQKDTTKGINSTQNALCHFDTPAQFHDYTVVWDSSVISIYYDGTLCLFDHWQAVGHAPPAPFDQLFFMALTAALGVPGTDNAFANGTTQLPATTRIDWVRAWK